MSDKTENTEIESEAPEASAAPLGEIKPASPEIASKTKSESTSANKAVFGTRKSKPGAAAGSNVKPLSQIRGVFDDDDEIEMDDLPVRATAPAHLVANDKPRQPRERDENRDGENRRGPRRERGERSNERPPRKPRAERPRPTEADEAPTETEALPTPVQNQEVPEVEKTEDRPERFGSVSEETLQARKSVQEFRPSQDGRRAKKSAGKRDDRPTRRESKAPAKKGFFAWLKSLFSAETVEEKPKGPSNRRPRGERSERGENGNRPRGNRRRRPNNGPRKEGDRPEGERPNRPRGERGENGNRPRGNRRRRSGGQGGGNRRPRPEGQQRPKSSPSE